MISVLCPTRGRPENMKKMLSSALETAANKVEIVFGVDIDDEPSVECGRDLAAECVISTRKPHLADNYNQMYQYCTGDIVMLTGDDVLFKTKNWDILVEQAFSKRIMLVYTDDGFFHGDMAVSPFIHKDWVETVGYVAPPGLSRHIDRWLWYVAKSLNRLKYIGNVLIYHPHFDGRPEDQTLRELASRYQWDTNSYNARQGERNLDISKLAREAKLLISLL